MTLLPPRLNPGDTVAVVAPASPPLDPGDLHNGLRALEERGLHPLLLRPSYASHGYLAGANAERAAEFNEALRRTDLRALFCVRGGYGSLRLLPHIDYEAARRHPKLLVGYSDITALHLALYHRAGLVGLSGAMVAPDWSAPDEEAEDAFWRVLRAQPPFELTGPAPGALETLRSGTAEGTLLGGNLTLITRLVGTPYLPALDGAILFVEEVAEAPYRIDGMLAHLRLAGILERLGGLVVGGLTGWTPNDRPTLSYDEVLRTYASLVPGPVVRGLAYGHFKKKLAVPVGVRARLDASADHASLTLLEPLTA